MSTPAWTHPRTALTTLLRPLAGWASARAFPSVPRHLRPLAAATARTHQEQLTSAAEASLTCPWCGSAEVYETHVWLCGERAYWLDVDDSERTDIEWRYLDDQETP